MARSHYIYTVTPAAGYVPVATFTVKHEMVTWTKQNFTKPEHVRVNRYPDGGVPLTEETVKSGSYRTELDMKELWGEE